MRNTIQTCLFTPFAFSFIDFEACLVKNRTIDSLNRFFQVNPLINGLIYYMS